MGNMPSDVHVDRQSSRPRCQGSMDERPNGGGGGGGAGDAGQSIYLQRYQALRDAGFDDTTANKYSPLYSSVNQVIDAILSQSLDDSLAVSGASQQLQQQQSQQPQPRSYLPECDEANSRCFDSGARSKAEQLYGRNSLIVTMLKDGLLEDSSDEITLEEEASPSASSSLSSGISSSFFAALDTATTTSSSSPSSFSSLSSSMSMTPPNHYEASVAAAAQTPVAPALAESGLFLNPPKQNKPLVGGGGQHNGLVETNDLTHLNNLETSLDNNLSSLIISNHQNSAGGDRFSLEQLCLFGDHPHRKYSKPAEEYVLFEPKPPAHYGCQEEAGTLNELLGYLNAQQSRQGSFLNFDQQQIARDGTPRAADLLFEPAGADPDEHPGATFRLPTFADIAASSLMGGSGGGSHDEFGSPLLDHRKQAAGGGNGGFFGAMFPSPMQSFYDGYPNQVQANSNSSKKFFADNKPLDFRAPALAKENQGFLGQQAAAAADPEHGQQSNGHSEPNRPTNLMAYKGLWICNVSPEVTVHYLKRRFRRFGHFTSIQTFERRATNGTNIVFVHYDNPYSPMEAIAALHNYSGLDLCAEPGEPLKLRFAPSMEQSRAGQLPTLEQARKVVEKSGECFNWRLSSGCHRGPRCHLKHIPINKEIDSQPWVKALKKKGNET